MAMKCDGDPIIVETQTVYLLLGTISVQLSLHNWS